MPIHANEGHEWDTHYSSYADSRAARSHSARPAIGMRISRSSWRVVTRVRARSGPQFRSYVLRQRKGQPVALCGRTQLSSYETQPGNRNARVNGADHLRPPGGAFVLAQMPSSTSRFSSTVLRNADTDAHPLLAL